MLRRSPFESESNSGTDLRLFSSMLRFSRFSGLQRKQQALALQAAAVAGERSGRSDHAVAGHDHGQRIAPVGGTDGAAGAPPAQPPGPLWVSGGAGVRDLG